MSFLKANQRGKHVFGTDSNDFLSVIRDVNLPLFGGIPLLFFAFRFFRNHFLLFLEKSLTKKKKKKRSRCPTLTLSGEFKELAPVERVQRACHCRESSKSFGTRVLAFSSSESKFESTVSPLGT